MGDQYAGNQYAVRAKGITGSAFTQMVSPQIRCGVYLDMISVMIRLLAAGLTGGRGYFLPFSLDDVWRPVVIMGSNCSLVSLQKSILIDSIIFTMTLPRYLCTIVTLN